MTDRPAATVIPFPAVSSCAGPLPDGYELHPLWRDPRSFPWGAFIMETQEHSFQSGFHWFARDQDLLAWLRHGFWEVFRQFRSSHGARYHPDREHFRRVLRGATTLSLDLLLQLDARQDMQVLWWGTLPALAQQVERDGMLASFFDDFIRTRSNPLASERDIDALIAAANDIRVQHPPVQEAWDAVRRKSAARVE